MIQNLAWLCLNSKKRSRTISKCLSSLPLLDCSKIYDLLSEVGQAWRRSWIIYQGTSLPRSLEQMPDGFNFTDLFFYLAAAIFARDGLGKCFYKMHNETLCWRWLCNGWELFLPERRLFSHTHRLHSRYLGPHPPLVLPLFPAGVKDVQNEGWLREGSWNQLGILGPPSVAKRLPFHLNIKYASSTYLFTKIQRGFLRIVFPPETGNTYLGK